MSGVSHKSNDGPAVAYLIVCDGRKCRDVYRLQPGEVITLGRAPTNRIVVRDEVCSRHHCKISVVEDRWILQDLGSRNGTLVNGECVSDDWKLEDGHVIQIGGSRLGFTHDLSAPLPGLDYADAEAAHAGETVEVVLSDLISESPPEIIHRKRKTRFYQIGTKDTADRDQTSHQLARLYRLALDMGSARDSKQLADHVLSVLLEGTNADIGAILLLKGKLQAESKVSQLRIVSYKSLQNEPYERVSNYLSRLVLTEWEAVLAHDVSDDSRLAGRDSLSELRVKSVICAPIRLKKNVHGLIHLYSTDLARAMDLDDLEFTLAVADQMAVAVGSIKQVESLATGLARVQDEYDKLRNQVAVGYELVGESASIRGLEKAIARIAPTDATVLIRGESGVGKELVARAIHGNSERRNRPFVCMNCAALSETLLESELFGHEKGAFTGATERKLGKFEQADGGTLFLDEVGEMSPAIQAKFLRVLEGHPFERVGGGRPIHVDVRVVAATNRDLERAVEEKMFRQDLFFRLYVVEIFVEPLREHKSDIPILADHFLTRSASRMHSAVTGFTADAMDALTDYDWPGNVRELQNCVERAVILCSGDKVTASDLRLTSFASEPERISPDSGRSRAPLVTLAELEQKHILSVLEQTSWNKSQSAQILGIERSTLDRKLKRYKVKRPEN